jgi:hypothetical protein
MRKRAKVSVNRREGRGSVLRLALADVVRSMNRNGFSSHKRIGAAPDEESRSNR